MGARSTGRKNMNVITHESRVDRIARRADMLARLAMDLVIGNGGLSEEALPAQMHEVLVTLVSAVEAIASLNREPQNVREAAIELIRLAK